MNNKPINLFTNQIRSEWVRLQTLILLRWMAIVGQIIAIISAQSFLGLNLEIGYCSIAIGASILFNLLASFLAPTNKRLSQKATILSLLFDLTQLGILLFFR